MTIYEKGLITILVVDAVSILISIPLVLRKIGPNVVYGYRTRATLSDPALWYEANALFGRRLIAACLVSALAAFLLARPGLLSPDTFLPVSVVLLGAPVAVALSAGFVPVRKAGKLPWAVVREEYELEYGTDKLEIHRDAIHPGERILVVDDVLATGGTAAATCRLAATLGAEIVGLAVLLELTALDGRRRLGDRRVESLLTY